MPDPDPQALVRRIDRLIVDFCRAFELGADDDQLVNPRRELKAMYSAPPEEFVVITGRLGLLMLKEIRQLNILDQPWGEFAGLLTSAETESEVLRAFVGEELLPEMEHFAAQHKSQLAALSPPKVYQLRRVFLVAVAFAKNRQREVDFWQAAASF